MDRLLFFTLILFLNSCGTTSSARFTFRGSTSQMSSSLIQQEDLPSKGSPKSLSLNVYAFYLGVRPDCTDLKSITDYGTATEGFNLALTPILFSANPKDETYHCIALKMSDVVTARLDGEAIESWPEKCQEGVDYNKDLYPATNTTTWKDLSGNPITKAGSDASPVSNPVYLFATTDVTKASTGTLALVADQVFSLSSSITFPSKITFFVDLNQKVNGNTTCEFGSATFGFR